MTAGLAGRRGRTSAECSAAEQLDWPEQHARCAGNTELRLPGADPRTAPLQTYVCSCGCHTDPPERIGMTSIEPGAPAADIEAMSNDD